MRILNLMIIISISILLTSNILFGQVQDALVIDASGNVGIGIKKPLYDLEVADHINAIGSISVGLIAGQKGWSLYNTLTNVAILEFNGDRAGISNRDEEVFTVIKSGNVGIGTTTPQVKLDVNGKLNCNGGSCSSDIRWKQDIKPLTNTLNKVLLMQGVFYNWKNEKFPDKNFDDRKQIGLIAQKVEPLYPELVFTDKEGYKSLDYIKLTVVLVEAIKDQQKIIESQNTKMEKFEAALQRLETKMAMKAKGNNALKVEGIDN